MIQLADVQVFLEIVSSGTFTGAAKVLKTPKSSTARQIARLETHLGCRLLDRSSRVVSLTDDGRSFLPHARRLLDDAAEAQGVLRSKNKGASGLLSVTSPGLFGRAFLAPLIPSFLERNPQVQLAMRLAAERVEIGSGLGQVDVAVRFYPISAPDLGNRRLGDISFALAASPGYLRSRGAPRDPEDLARHALIDLGPAGKAHVLNLKRNGEVRSLNFSPLLHVDEPEVARGAAVAGCGIATLPKFLLPEEVRSGRLVPLLDDWIIAPAPIHVIYRTALAPSLRVRAFVDFLFETIGKTQPWHAEL